MKRIVVRLEYRVKLKLRGLRRETSDKGLAMRCQIILRAGKGRRREEIAEGVGCSVSWVNRVISRFDEFGIAGLIDRREDNGQEKADERFHSLLYDVIESTPRDHGYRRPTWTRELVVQVMWNLIGVKVHPTTMGRALKRIGARLGRPRPTVGCPWPKQRRQRRMPKIKSVLNALPENQLAFYLDEVDIHLNPKIGPDWMNKGKQKQVQTPGQNVKRYLCGALNADTGQVTWVRSEKKSSLIFIAMLNKLVQTNPKATVIHVVLDNFKIHSSKASQAAVESHGGKVVLHFLPPYCPNENKIERLWLDLHANVTRNHRCATIEELMREVAIYLNARNRRKDNELKPAA